MQVFVQDAAGEALKDVVVYLKPLDGQQIEKKSSKVVISQIGKSFTPYITVSQVNTAVDFVNQDDITHHIYSAGSDNKFSFKIRAGQTNSLSQFNQAAEVAMGCNIHDWMSGYLLVVDTPYFGKTDENGLANFYLPEKGKYEIVVWHPQMQSENNRMIKEEMVQTDSIFTFRLTHKMNEIPIQENDDDFDFLSDYE